MPPDSADRLSRTARADDAARPDCGFRHELLCYAEGDRGFLAGALEPVRSAHERGAGVLVAVGPERMAALRSALGGEATGISFADVRELARNPARVIPALADFARANAQAPPLGIVEAAWPQRSAAELGECERHECLLDLAFAAGPSWRLMCAYDLDALSEETLQAARRAHPLLAGASAGTVVNGDYLAARPPEPFAGSLPEPPDTAEELAFEAETLTRLRRATRAWASGEGLCAEAADELVLAVDELAANSIRHGGGAGTLRRWREHETLVCEVRDGGTIEQPLIGRLRPPPQAQSGRGVWLVNQLCDLVQIRSKPGASAVRVHKRLA
jgi:anti-sigma regulatory factor (Ser/Thr protein kinase)